MQIRKVSSRIAFSVKPKSRVIESFATEMQALSIRTSKASRNVPITMKYRRGKLLISQVQTDYSIANCF